MNQQSTEASALDSNYKPTEEDANFGISNPRFGDDLASRQELLERMNKWYYVADIEKWDSAQRTLKVLSLLPQHERARLLIALNADQIAELEADVTEAKLRVDFTAHPDNAEINSKLSLFAGDITLLQVDAIVNAANEQLTPGDGVCGCIHYWAGPELEIECSQLDGCTIGQAKVTKAYNLPSKYVIHTVGPRGNQPELLRQCYESCLQQITEIGIRTIAFCCISTGKFGYPNLPAAHVALLTVRKWLENKENRDKIDRIIFDVRQPKDQCYYEALMQVYFPDK